MCSYSPPQLLVFDSHATTARHGDSISGVRAISTAFAERSHLGTSLEQETGVREMVRSGLRRAPQSDSSGLRSFAARRTCRSPAARTWRELRALPSRCPGMVHVADDRSDATHRQIQ